MEPQTITVPIFKCHSLMFWLEPGVTRSGQFVLYDMKVSKKPCNIQPPTKISTNATAEVVEPEKKAEPAKAAEPVKKAEPAPAPQPQPKAEPQPQPKEEPKAQPAPQTKQESAPAPVKEEAKPKPAPSKNVQQTNQPAASQIVIPKGNSVNQSKSGNSLAPKK